LIIELSQYLERRRRTAEARVMQIATVSRLGRRVVARQGSAGAQAEPGAAVRWSSFLPLFPALDLAVLYAEASLI